MKKNLLTLLTFVLFFTSCSKENIVATEELTEGVTEELQIAQNSLFQSRSILLFANLELNHETNTTNGFLINNRGELYNISNLENAYLNRALDLSSGYISDQVMRQILDHATKDTESDLSVFEVADYIKMTGILKKHEELEANNPTATTTQVLLNFSVNPSRITPESCGPGVYDHGPSHYKVIISARGKYNVESNSTNSLELMNWLNNLQGPTVVDAD